MAPPQQRRTHALLAIVLAVSFAATGCSSPLAPQNDAPPTSTPEPSVSEVPDAESEAPDESEVQFTDATLAQICVEATTSAFDTDVTFAIEDTRVEERTVEPRWLVLVPVQTNGHAGEAQCTIGGSPDSPVVEMSTASITPLPEQQIENLINGQNEGGTE